MGILISPNRAMFHAERIEAEKVRKCDVCPTWAEYSRGRWLINTYVEDGEVEGHELTGAMENDYGFFCSEPCSSQGMYKHSEEWEKKLMDNLLDRLRGIQEDWPIVSKLVNKWMPNLYISECLVAEAHINEKSLLGDGEPSWSNR